MINELTIPELPFIFIYQNKYTFLNYKNENKQITTCTHFPEFFLKATNFQRERKREEERGRPSDDVSLLSRMLAS